ncbi:MAG: Fic family protein [Microvirga sp.]
MSDADPYVYPGTNVLKNKLGVQDQDLLAVREQYQSAIALERMRRSPVTGAFDFDHYRDIHRQLFGKIYDFAGEVRTIDLWKTEVVLKGDSVLYSDTPDIEGDTQRAISELRNTKWKDLSARPEAGKFAATIAELWRAHPFREGNTRTLFAFVEQFTRQQNLALDQAVLSRVPSETRDALALATTGEISQLATLIASARRSELQRAHPELGRLSSEAVEVIRLLGNPQIRQAQIGAEVRGQVLTTSYDHVLVQRSNQVAAVPLRSFPQRPENNQRITVRVLGPDEVPDRASVRVEAPPPAVTVRALIPPKRQVDLPLLSPEAIEAHLGRHSQVRHARANLEAAAEKVFREPYRAVHAVARHRGPKPQPPAPPRDEDLRGRRTTFGEDKDRKVARAAVPAFDASARALQVAIAAALVELKAEAEQRVERDRIPVPAPSAGLSEALAQRAPKEIAADPVLMDEVKTIQTALYERYGRPEAAILASGNPEEAAKLLPEGMALDEVRAVLKPLRETVLAEQELAHTRSQKQSLTQEGPQIGYGR